MSDAAVAFAGLGHSYRPGKWVFRHYSAALERGRVLAILGPNGSGKTTLLRLLLGAERPSEGRIAIKGQAAFVPQLFQVGFDYSVLNMVLMGRAKHIGVMTQPSARDETAAMAALDHFALAGLAHRPFHELSGGQRQMVIFARALVSEADILILDEPTSALDLKNQIVILDWVARLAHEGLTVLFTTHHPDHALAIADDALLMLGENQFAFGAPGEVLSEENLRSLYGVPIRRIAFRHEGGTAETFAPVLHRAKRLREDAEG